MTNHIFLTGSTGFLGRNILKLLLEKEKKSKISLLVRANSQSNAEQRMKEIIESIQLDQNSKVIENRVNVLWGDVSLKNLGLTSNLYTNLAKDVTHIIHSAAAVSFNQSLEKARKINVTGTENILKLKALWPANRYPLSLMEP